MSRRTENFGIEQIGKPDIPVNCALPVTFATASTRKGDWPMRVNSEAGLIAAFWSSLRVIFCPG